MIDLNVTEVYLRYKSKSLYATKKIAEHVLKNYVKGKRYYVLLRGEFGSGKTTFVRFCIDYMLGEGVFNGSPSFTLVNEYEHGIYHMDLYRLNDESEFMEAGIYDYLNKEEGLFFIEWARGFVPHDMVITFHIVGDEERVIDVKFKD